MNQYDIQSILNSPKILIGKGASKLIRTYTVNDLLFIRAKHLPNITANNPPSESHHNNDNSNQVLAAPIMNINTDIGNIAITAGESSGDPKPSTSFQGTSSIFEGDLMPLFEGVIFDGGDPTPTASSGGAQIHFEDDTERMWRKVYGESLMDHHMLSETENSELSYFGEAGTSIATTTASDWTVDMDLDLDFTCEFTADDLDLLNITRES